MRINILLNMKTTKGETINYRIGDNRCILYLYNDWNNLFCREHKIDNITYNVWFIS